MKRTAWLAFVLLLGCDSGSSLDAGLSGDAGGAIDASARDAGSPADAAPPSDAGRDAGDAFDAGADAGTTDAAVDTGPEPLPPQDGGPCTYAGVEYDDCYIGQAWTGARRFVDVSNTLVLDSSVRNAVDAPCVFVRNADRIDLVNLDLEDCDETGIRISNTTDSRNVRILGGRIVNTGRAAGSNGSCITAGQTGSVTHPGLVIDGIAVDECGFDDLDHGIYVQAQEYIIRNVVVGDVTGNGISVRSSGLVEGCRVDGEIGESKARIRYFNDHPCGPSDRVRFVDNDVDHGGTGLSLLWSGSNAGFACENYEIRGHGDTAVQVDSEFDSLSVDITP